jgi:hypothetical protein
LDLAFLFSGDKKKIKRNIPWTMPRKINTANKSMRYVIQNLFENEG